jgi:superfamily II DNA or RNA helicase
MSEPPHRTGRWERDLAGDPPPLPDHNPRFTDVDIEKPIDDRNMMAFCEKVKSRFGRGLYLWQIHAMQKLLSKRDLFIKAATGSGKSMPFQAMALSAPDAVVLVVAPITGLMKNQVPKHCMSTLTCTG